MCVCVDGSTRSTVVLRSAQSQCAISIGTKMWRSRDFFLPSIREGSLLIECERHKAEIVNPVHYSCSTS